MTDNTDKKILNVLLANSRLSYRQIAKKAGVSPATAINRINRMRSEGIINRYTASLNYDKLGYGMHVVIEARVSKGMLFETETNIAQDPDVFAVYDVTGGFDIIIIARFKNTKQLDSFVKKLQKMPHVVRTHTKLILNVIKEEKMEI